MPGSAKADANTCSVLFLKDFRKSGVKDQSEVIDGQQRLTTLMLMLRAFYDKFANMKDKNSILTRDRIEKCIWKTDTFGTADKNTLKIDSEVATDNDKEEFLELLRTGIVKQGSKSQYVLNYQFFQKKIDGFLQEFPSFFPYLPARILGNCILLPIEAESQDTALRIFSTLNDRGLPLSDADIFKAQFYKYYGSLGNKDEFIAEWKKRVLPASMLNFTPPDEVSWATKKEDGPWIHAQWLKKAAPPWSQ